MMRWTPAVLALIGVGLSSPAAAQGTSLDPCACPGVERLYQAAGRFGPVGQGADEVPPEVILARLNRDEPIRRLIVGADNAVRSLQVLYGDRWSEPMGIGGPATEEVVLDQCDFVTDVTGYVGTIDGEPSLVRLEIGTRNRLSYGPFGTMSGAKSLESFAFRARAGEQIAALEIAVGADPARSDGVTGLAAITAPLCPRPLDNTAVAPAE